MNVLIVDDEEQIRSLVGRILTSKGHNSALANDPSAARRHLKKGRFQLVISDFSMPGETGLEFLRYVLSTYPDTATIMMSGSGDPKLQKEALQAGVLGYIEKPFGLGEMLNCINEAMNCASRHSRGLPA